MSTASRSRSVDQLADSLIPIAQSQREKPLAFIENEALFGDLAQQSRFVEAYRWALDIAAPRRRADNPRTASQGPAMSRALVIERR